MALDLSLGVVSALLITLFLVGFILLFLYVVIRAVLKSRGEREPSEKKSRK